MPFIGKELAVDTINGAAFLIDGKFFREIGFFDEGTFLFNEELILGKTIQNKGYTCLLNGNSIVNHLQGLSTKSKKESYNIKMEYEKIRSEVYYLKKYLSVNKALRVIFSIYRRFEIYILYILKK